MKGWIWLALGCAFFASPAAAEQLCDIKALTLSLESTAAPKSQFETDDEFKARQVSAVKNSDVKTTGIVCEIVRAPEGGEDYFRYDPKSKSVKIDIPFLKSTQVVDTEVLGEREATSGFGTNVTIQNINRVIYQANFDRQPDMKFSIPMDVETAKSTWNELSLAVQFDIAQPAIIYEKRTLEPSTDLPREGSQTFKMLNGVPTEIILIRRDTMETLWEKKL